MRTVTIPVEGMTCAACAGRVRHAVQDIPGVSSVEVDLVGRSARVEYAEGEVTPDQIASAIDALGYTAGAPVQAPAP